MNKTILQKLDAGRQYRQFDVGSFERREDDGEKIVQGYATTFNEPYLLWQDGNYTVYEEIDARAFDGCDMADVIMQYNHEGRVFARTSNETLSVRPDERGLRTRANLGGTELGRQLFEEIEGGYTTKMSFGFKVKEDRRETTEDRETGKVTILRTVTRIEKLYDVSAVSIPANDATEISARAYGEGVIAEAKQEMLERRKKKIRLLMEV